MKNKELELLTDCRFCRMDYAVKGPQYSNWQNLPYKLDSIPATGNVGILTGEYSNGIIAIDFDGPWAWDYWAKNIPVNIETLYTTTWSSGKDARCQMAFTIPEEMWPFIKTFKFTEPGIDKKIRKPDGLEFRWNGVQSVLPPSMHPDTNKEYFWVVPPSACMPQPINLDLLDWMLNHTIEKPVEIKEYVFDDKDVDKVAELDAVMQTFKECYPSLSYDEWIVTTFACITHCGVSAGSAVMSIFYPEDKAGEYANLAKRYSNQRTTPGIGSLISMIRRVQPNYRIKASTCVISQKLKRIEELKKEIQNVAG